MKLQTLEDATQECMDDGPEGLTLEHLREVFCSTCLNSGCPWSSSNRSLWLKRMERQERGRQHLDIRDAESTGISNPGFEPVLEERPRLWSVAQKVSSPSPVVPPNMTYTPGEIDQEVTSGEGVDRAVEKLAPAKKRDPDQKKEGVSVIPPAQAPSLSVESQEVRVTSDQQLTREVILKVDQTGQMTDPSKAIPSRLLAQEVSPASSPWAASSDPNAPKQKKVVNVRTGQAAHKKDG